MIAQPCRTPKARHALSGVCVIDILDILTGNAGEEADARALPLPDGPMRSLATLGVPPIHLGDVAGGIPLSRLTDVVWRDANDFTPLAQSSHSESTIPLSRLTDVLWRGPSAVVPGEQGSVSGASARAWNDSGATDHAAMQPWPSFDPRSGDLAAPPTVVGKAAHAPDSAQVAGAVRIRQPQESGSWGNNVPRIVVRPWQFDPRMTPEGGAEIFSNRSDPQSYPNIEANVDPALADDRFDLREQGRPPLATVTPAYDGNRNLEGDGTFTFGDDVEDRLVPASWPGVMASDDARGRRETPPFATDAANREVLEYDRGGGAPLRGYGYGLGPDDALDPMNVAPGARTTQPFLPDIQGSIIPTVDSGTGALTNVGPTAPAAR